MDKVNDIVQSRLLRRAQCILNRRIGLLVVKEKVIWFIYVYPQ